MPVCQLVPFSFFFLFQCYLVNFMYTVVTKANPNTHRWPSGRCSPLLRRCVCVPLSNIIFRKNDMKRHPQEDHSGKLHFKVFIMETWHWDLKNPDGNAVTGFLLTFIKVHTRFHMLLNSFIFVSFFVISNLNNLNLSFGLYSHFLLPNLTNSVWDFGSRLTLWEKVKTLR